MKKILITLTFFLFVALSIYFISKNLPKSELINNTNIETEVLDDSLSMANPASVYCENSGGIIEIIIQEDGSEFGICKFEDFECEEWAYYRDECDIQGDAEKIKQVLINKGLNLEGMQVVIRKHLGKYIEGSVIPISVPAGGGYVFAVKTDNEIKILADGNGAILCEYLFDYPDFPSYLISECVDSSGNVISR